MAKKIAGFLKLQVPAGAANPSPPIGPALGQRGLNIMAFCKDFNAKTSQMEKGSPIPVVITIYGDKSFTFEMRTPPVAYFIKKAAKLESGWQNPERAKAKFDKTVEIAMNLGVDPRHADQMVRGVVTLPNGTAARSASPCSRAG